VGELARQLARPAAAATAAQLVRPVGKEAPFGLALRESLARSAQIPQQQVYPLVGVGCRGGFGQTRRP
jgi:hypothetical protein